MAVWSGVGCDGRLAAAVTRSRLASASLPWKLSEFGESDFAVVSTAVLWSWASSLLLLWLPYEDAYEDARSSSLR